MSVVNVSDANYKEVLAAGQPVVLDFWAEWCGPCRMVSPIIDELAEEYAGRITVGKVNVDENDTAVAEYGIRNIPTVLFFKDGQVVDKQVRKPPSWRRLISCFKPISSFPPHLIAIRGRRLTPPMNRSEARPRILLCPRLRKALRQRPRAKPSLIGPEKHCQAACQNYRTLR